METDFAAGTLSLGGTRRFAAKQFGGAKARHRNKRRRVPLSIREVAMAWIDDDAWWERRDGGLHAGPTLYWLATIVAILIAVFAVADFFISWAEGAPIVRIVAFIAALAVWLSGRICRALLS